MGIADKKTQMYFPEELFKRIQRKARAESKSTATLVREAVEKYLGTEEGIDWGNDPIFGLEGIMDSGIGDLSENHDEYLYGRKSE
ncbi:MAG: ribbon-helix-helix protein, CopG family [Desulfobacterales bacterium]|nr:ribbon-helix-helix protein, CopG family [Desulfobacterales bacterium]